MLAHKYFKLFACCIPVKGYSRSIICDFQRFDFELIPNMMYELLTKYEKNTIQEIKDSFENKNSSTIDNYFQFLIDKEFGFWCDKPELENFPKLDIHWESPTKINNVIIDVNECSKHDYIKIVSDLEILGCKAVEFRFYNVLNLSEVESILKCFEKSRVRIIYLVMVFHDELTKKNLDNLCFSHQRINHIWVTSSKIKRAYYMKNSFGIIEYIKDKIDSNLCCGKINPKYFRVNIELFTESNLFNSCLNKKVGIDVNGEIKNCPSMHKSYGNINTENLVDVINFNPEFSSIWSITKDQVLVCKDCEFRYICTDCRVFIENKKDNLSKPSKCTYNPYKAKWEK